MSPDASMSDEPQFHMSGLGLPLFTDWMSMDTPVGPALLAAGPHGWMEFGEQGWRMFKPFQWDLGG